MTTEQAQTVAEIRGVLNGGDYPKVYYREALALVPEYIMIRPGVDAWREGDEWHENGMTWTIHAANRDIGKPVNIPFAGRPIPVDVRESMAVIAMYEANQLPEYPVPAIAKAVSIVGKWILQGGRND